jgi:tRNA pseudouridine38-40 synthase
MARYQVIVVYDGTKFSGFQRQAHDRTVQGVFEDALKCIGWLGGSIIGAGRTDAGVHASGQVVAFDMEWKHTLEALRAALNANLPPDVAVNAVDVAAADFHPRYGAIARTYRYQIYISDVRDPMRERYAWRIWPQLDLRLLQQAAKLLQGSHDFVAFGTPPRPGGKTFREVYSAQWNFERDKLDFEISANAFLYHMVRRLVSVQVSIAQGKLPLETFAEYLEKWEGQVIQGLAPAHGLTLIRVDYPS